MRNLMKCIVAGAAFAMATLSSPLLASTLLDMGAPNFTTVRIAGAGPGQLVNVATNTSLTNIGFYSATPNGGNVKYMIWDGTNSTLLFSIVGTTVTGSTPTLTFSPDFAFHLLAGSSYYFGIISDSALDVGTINTGAITLTQNGLTATGSNSNYNNFASPAFVGLAGASINLVLLGTQTGAVPEPATWMMMLIGFGAIGWSVRRGRKSAQGLAKTA
jgi:hypothetical protein